MRLIGLCGKSGSGKSLFRQIAENEGIKVIDCDKVYAQLVSYRSPCLLEIAEVFGEEAIKDDSLNRRYLAPIVFSDKEKLGLLNEITHKHIIVETEKMLSQWEKEIILLDAPTLFESGLWEWCQCIVGVIAPTEKCIERIVLRDNISADEAKMRLSKQYNDDFIIENSDVVIYNDSDIETFETASLELVKELKESII